jgi:3-dehydroquinate dehydratase-2
MKTVLVLNGPNLNRLGTREPEIYGSQTLGDIAAQLKAQAAGIGLSIDFRQTNSEAELVGWLHEATDSGSDVILNPAAFTHYSYAVRDAAAELTAKGLKLIEVHLSNPHAREDFRKSSVISPIATGVIAGFGSGSYALALSQLALG